MPAGEDFQHTLYNRAPQQEHEQLRNQTPTVTAHLSSEEAKSLGALQQHRIACGLVRRQQRVAVACDSMAQAEPFAQQAPLPDHIYAALHVLRKVVLF